MGNQDGAANTTDKDVDMDKDVGTSDQDNTSDEESSVDPVDAPVAILMQMDQEEGWEVVQVPKGDSASNDKALPKKRATRARDGAKTDVMDNIAAVEPAMKRLRLTKARRDAEEKATENIIT
ncbi:uncharacterized protein C8Q71DRAFT_859634 [Rhodofomes roseus]|uniref:Uncharacterized protein n=1 Tax=Rhodofomes roseus TaxID=34475 RepID=A0ABQ8KBA6_9APHY|nr:uncharacterized protein C8Q71DRAFT_859634 [Rhodofomes roseus]KAH9834672.1 hypothetical protein C8Q71DRAFT_859634 [Rhodofomes roseus]